MATVIEPTFIQVPERTTDPAAPTGDNHRIYIRNGDFYRIGSDGIPVWIGGGGGIPVAVATSVTIVADSGAAQSINPSVEGYVVTLTASCVFTISAPAYNYVRLRLRTIQGTGGGFAISFTNTVTYDYGTAPVPLTAEANITDYALETLDGGTTWRLALVADGVSS